MNKPQPQLLIIWRIGLTLSATIPAFLISLFLRIGSTAWTVTICGFGLLYLGMYLVYFPALYKKMSFSISEEKIVYTTGVFNTRILSIPVPKIQFTSVSRSPITRMFGLAAVVAVLAGGRVVIPGLKFEDADRIARLLQSHKL